jgi:hypothetical protein
VAQWPRAGLLNRSAATVADQARWIAARPAGEFNYVIEMIGGPPTTGWPRIPPYATRW